MCGTVWGTEILRIDNQTLFLISGTLILIVKFKLKKSLQIYKCTLDLCADLQMYHIYDMSKIWHNQFHSFLICIYMCIYMIRKNFAMRNLCFSKRCILGEGKESVLMGFHTEFLFPWNPPGKLCMILGHFAIAFYFPWHCKVHFCRDRCSGGAVMRGWNGWRKRT